MKPYNTYKARIPTFSVQGK